MLGCWVCLLVNCGSVSPPTVDSSKNTKQWQVPSLSKKASIRSQFPWKWIFYWNNTTSILQVNHLKISILQCTAQGSCDLSPLSSNTNHLQSFLRAVQQSVQLRFVASSPRKLVLSCIRISSSLCRLLDKWMWSARWLVVRVVSALLGKCDILYVQVEWSGVDRPARTELRRLGLVNWSLI